jgi:hypothetical protein
MSRKTPAIVIAIACLSLSPAAVLALDGLDTAFTAESPSGLIGDATPTFEATASDAAATLECRHFATGDPAPPAFEPCAQPFTIGPLADGEWRVEARAVLDGVPDDTPDVRVVTVDTVPPEVSVERPPADTADPTPEVGGTAGTADGDAADVTVRILDGATALHTATVPRDASTGEFAFTVPDPLSDGSYTAEAVQRDGAGNETTELRTFKVDTGAPVVAITSPGAGAVTADDTPEVAGTAGDEDGPVTVDVWSGTDTSGPAARTLGATPAGGDWAVDVEPALGEGTWTAIASQSDAAGNAGSSAPVTFRVDMTAPAPGVDPVGDTADATPAVSGAAGDDEGDGDTITVEVFAGASATGSPVRTLTPSRTGDAWSATLSPDLGDGTYTVRARQSDAAGNEGVSGPRTLKVDTVGPAPTVDPEPDGNDATPMLSGGAGDEDGSHEARSADAGSVTVRVWPGTDTSGPAARTLVAARAGAGWSIEVATALTDGTWTAIASQADGVGNVGVSAPRSFKVDTAAPAPAITAPAALTNDATPPLAGTAGTEDGTDAAQSADADEVRLELFEGSGTSGTSVLDVVEPVTAGAWAHVLAAALPDGTYTLRVTQFDGTGNSGSAMLTFEVDTAAPAPTVDPIGDTADATPAVSGTGGDGEGDEDTLAVEVFTGATTTGSPVRTLTPSRIGDAWSATIAPDLADGTYTVRVTQGDEAGNGGSAARTFKVDTSAPAPTVDPKPDGNDTAPVLSGGAGAEDGSDTARSADAGSVTVRVWSGTDTSGPAARSLAATRSGAGWSVEVAPELADGTWTAIASQADGAGNVGVSAARSFKVDTAAPAPTVDPVPDGNDATPILSGGAGSEDGSQAARSAAKSTGT